MLRRLFARPTQKVRSKPCRLLIQTLEPREVPAQFTAGDLVVFRVGDGSAALTNASTASFLDEYAPDGTLVQSIALPTAAAGGNLPLTVSGSATSEGFVTRSDDGRFLVFAGYDVAPGLTGVASSTSATAPREIGTIAADGTINTTTTTTNYSANNIRSAASTNGLDLWSVGANTGVVYQTIGTSGAGTVVSATSVNNRIVNVFDGQLYISSGSGTNTFRGVSTVGTGAPTTAGQTAVRLPGLTDTTDPSTYGYYFADLSTAVPGVDTLYVADDGAGALTKFSLVSGSWVKNNTVGVAGDAYRGLTGSTVGNTVTLYATRAANSLVSLVDNSGYNANMPTTVTTLVNAATNTAFRGVAFTPVNVAPINTVPSSFNATEDTNAVVAGVSVGDGDARLASVTVTLQVANGTLTVDTGVTNGITAGQITSGNGTNTVVITAPIVNINATFSSAAGITYAPTANFNGNDTFTVTTNDLGNTGSGGAKQDIDSVTIAVAPVIDDPSITDATTDEDTQTTSGLVFSRNAVDGPEVAYAKIISVPVNGTLYDGATALNAGDFIPYADANTNLSYKPNPDYNGTDTFQIQASLTNSDTGLGGAIVSPTITINAVNDPPVNSVPGDQDVDEDTTVVFSSGNGNLINVGDVDAGTADVMVTLTATNGTLTLGGTANLSVTGDGTATVVVTGAIADLNAGLDGLTFQPDANYNGAASVQIVTDDQGNTGSGGALTDTDSVTINLAAVNDAPVNSVPPSQVGTEDTATVFSTGNSNLISISDVDAGTADVQITLTSTHGILTLGETTNLTVTGNGSASIVAAGSLADLNAGLDGLTFQPDANYNGSASVQIVTDDQGNTGSGGPLIATDSIAIDVTPVNDVPVNTLPTSFATDEDNLLTLSGVSVADVDAGTSDITVTFSIPAGTGQLRVSGLVTGGVDGAQITGNNSASVTVTAPIAAINTTLADGVGLIYFPAQNFNGSVALGMTTDDNGNTGFGGPLTDTDSATIAVAAINDAPFVVVPGDQTAQEDVPFVFTLADGNPITVGDVDAGSGLKLTVTAQHGTIQFTPVSGLVVLGNSTATVTATGSVADLNSALSGMTYTGDLNYNGTDLIKAAVDDQGNTGSGGPLSTFQSIFVTVDAVNDAPVNTLPSLALVTEDIPFAFTGANTVNIADVDAGTGIMSVSLSAGHGTLQLSSTPGVTITNNGTSAVTASGTVDDLNVALAGLTYTTNLNYNGSDSIQLVTDDGGNTGSGGPQTDTDTITIGILPVNDPPAFDQDPYSFAPVPPLTVSEVIGTVHAVDPESNLFTYAIASGDPGGNFSINANTGVITVASTVDLQTSYSLTVTATDNDPFMPATGSTTVLIAANSAPTSPGIPAQQMNEDGGTFNLDLSAFFNDAEQTSASLTYTITGNTDAGLFQLAAIAGDSLSLTPVADGNGASTITIHAADSSGLFVESSFLFTVNPVNDVPTIDSINDLTIGNNTGVNTVPLTGLTAGPANESTQTLTITARSSDTSVIPDPTVQYLGGTTGSLQFAPVSGSSGSAVITVTVQDSGGGTDTTITTFQINVFSVNSPPVIDTTFTPLLPAILKNPLPKGGVITGMPISTLLAHVTDTDVGDGKGVAITGFDTTNGHWEYTVNNGGTWTTFPTVSDSSALLLVDDGVTQIRFIPNVKPKGKSTIKTFTKGFADISYRAWDQTDGATPVTPLVDAGNPADSAFSQQTEHAWVVVGKATPVIDFDGHPVLKPISVKAKASASYTVKTFLGLLAKETDATKLFGIAVSATDGTGTWQFNTGKGGWQTIGTVDDTQALLLRPTDKVRFQPAVGFNGHADLTYHTWDQTVGTFGTKIAVTATNFSVATETAIANVAPTLTPVHPTMPSVSAGATTAPVLVSALLGTAASDVEQSTLGMYVSGATGGLWEYSLDGVTWTKVTKPVYLQSTAQLRFTATTKAKAGAKATLSFKAWDETLLSVATLSKVADKITVNIV